MFPFYAVGQDDMLYRVQKNGVRPINMRVCYLLGGRQKQLLQYFRQTDTLIFSSEIFQQEGNTVCSLFILQGEALSLIAQNVRFDSVKISHDSSVAFITADKKLMHYANGNLSHVADNALKCELAAGDKLVYMLDEGKLSKNGFLYPTYCATSDYRFFIDDAQDMVKDFSNESRIFLLKEKRIVQKRAASVSVADCIILLDGQEVAQIPSVVLSQFELEGSNYLLSCDEAQSTLQFLLYKINGEYPTAIAKNVLAGKSVSFDKSTYAFEMFSNNKIGTFVVDKVTTPIKQNVTLDNIFCFNQKTYILDNDKRLLCDDSIVLEGVKHVFYHKQGLVCFLSSGDAFSVQLVNEKGVSLLAKNVLLTDFVLEDEYFYFFGGDSVSHDLFVATPQGELALLPNCDTTLEIICSSGDIAARRLDNQILYYSLNGQIFSTFLPIKTIVK